MIETLRSILQKDNTYAQYTPMQLNNLIPNVVNMINQQVSMGDFSVIVFFLMFIIKISFCFINHILLHFKIFCTFKIRNIFYDF